MASIAGVGGVDVGRVFSGGGRAIMAGRTGLAGGTVVKGGRCPICWRMAILAGIGTANMSC